jgi:hypothetical protein
MTIMNITQPHSSDHVDLEREQQDQLADLLAELAELVRSYVVLSDEQLTAVVLWVAHTHAIEAADATPYLQISSAEKRSGKTRLLEVLEPLVRRPLMAANASDAALFRAIDQGQTLLLDECDAIFAANRHGQDDKRALLNAGHRRSGRVLRCDGQDHEPREFKVFSAKALAGIGKLPDTVADRCIPIVLQRKLAGEQAQPLRQKHLQPIAEPLRERLQTWAESAAPVLEESDPLPVAGLNDDRAAEGWEPLLAIAELAGPKWEARARQAALSLSGPERDLESSPGVELLAAIKNVFDRSDQDALPTLSLIVALSLDEDSPYQNWSEDGRPAKGVPHRLAKMLRPYRIRPTDLRTSNGVVKGYRSHDFTEAWERNLPPEAPPGPDDEEPPNRLSADQSPTHPAPLRHPTTVAMQAPPNADPRTRNSK